MNDERMNDEPVVATVNDERSGSTVGNGNGVGAPAIAGTAVDMAVPWGWRAIGKAVLLIVLGSIGLIFLLVIAMMALGMMPDAAASMATVPLFSLGLGMYALVVLAVYLFGVRGHLSGWRALGWRSFSGGWIAALPFLAMVQLTGMAVINTAFVLPFVGGDFENPQVEAITGGGALSTNDLLLLMVLIAIVAPLAEELFFRGMLYPVLRRRWSMWPAIVINGLLFSVIHLIPVLLPGLFFVGMVLAWVREKSNSLIPCILLHALQNGIVLFGIYMVANGLAGV